MPLRSRFPVGRVSTFPARVISAFPVRFSVAGAIAVAMLAFVLTGTAGAHVTVNPSEATQGGFAKLTFRVPNEESNASTIKLDVQLPPDHPLASVSVKPVPGWTATTTMAQLATPITSHGEQITQAVSVVSWSGGSIKPGEFQEFEVSVGPLPSDTDSLVFKAVQTYDDGDVVRWIETEAAGSPEPAHPAPVLRLVKAGATDGAAATGTAGTAGGTEATAASGSGAGQAAGATSAVSQSDVDRSQTLAIIGIVLGALGVIGAAAALVTRRRPSAPPPRPGE